MFFGVVASARGSAYTWPQRRQVYWVNILSHNFARDQGPPSGATIRSKSRRNFRTLGAPHRRHASLSLDFSCLTVAASASSDTASVVARVSSVNTRGFSSVMVRLVLLRRHEVVNRGVKPVLSMPLPMTAAAGGCRSGQAPGSSPSRRARNCQPFFFLEPTPLDRPATADRRYPAATSPTGNPTGPTRLRYPAYRPTRLQAALTSYLSTPTRLYPD